MESTQRLFARRSQCTSVRSRGSHLHCKQTVAMDACRTRHPWTPPERGYFAFLLSFSLVFFKCTKKKHRDGSFHVVRVYSKTVGPFPRSACVWFVFFFPFSPPLFQINFFFWNRGGHCGETGSETLGWFLCCHHVFLFFFSALHHRKNCFSTAKRTCCSNPKLWITPPTQWTKHCSSSRKTPIHVCFTSIDVPPCWANWKNDGFDFVLFSFYFCFLCDAEHNWKNVIPVWSLLPSFLGVSTFALSFGNQLCVCVCVCIFKTFYCFTPWCRTQESCSKRNCCQRIHYLCVQQTKPNQGCATWIVSRTNPLSFSARTTSKCIQQLIFFFFSGPLQCQLWQGGPWQRMPVFQQMPLRTTCPSFRLTTRGWWHRRNWTGKK